MIKNRIRKQNGFAAADALIAILILSIFTGIIATLSYNVYIASVATKRNVEADSYIIDFFEHVDLISFEDVTEQNLIDYINNLGDSKISAREYNQLRFETPYKMQIEVLDYIPDGSTIGGLTKIVHIAISYDVAKKTNTIEIHHLKTNNI